MVSPVEEMFLLDRACLLDRQDNLKDTPYENVVTGCVEGAKIAEHLAKHLIETAAGCVLDAGNLMAPKETLDDMLDQIEQLELCVKRARNRQPLEVPFPEEPIHDPRGFTTRGP